MSAESELDSARDKRSDPEAELSRIEMELEAVQGEHRCDVDVSNLSYQIPT